MNQADALCVLSLASLTDAKTLKRAYLRQVKEHPPERDPEGFARVRQAYEFLEQRVSLSFGLDSQSLGLEGGPSSQTAAVDSTVSNGTVSNGTASESPAMLEAPTRSENLPEEINQPAPASSRPAPNSTEPDEAKTAPDRATEPGTEKEPESVRAEPNHALESRERDDFRTLLAFDEAPYSQERPTGELSPRSPLIEFQLRLFQDELLEAKAALEEWFETPEPNEDCGAEILNLYFRLFAEGHERAAHELFASLERRLDARGDELALFGELKSKLAVARAFEREAPHLEESSRRLAADVLAPLDFDGAADRLEALRSAHPAAAYKSLERRLAIRKGLLLDVLFPPPAPVERAERRWTSSFPFLMLFALFQVLRACVSSTTESPDSKSESAPATESRAR